MTKPEDRDQQSFVNFIENEQPLCQKDCDFIYHKDDLVTLRSGMEHTWLDAIVETMLVAISCKPITVSAH